MEENTLKNSSISAISYIVFFGTIGIVLLNLLSVVFPALLVSTFGTHAEFLSPFEIGYQGIPLVIINIALFGLGILYYKKRSSSFHAGINKIRNFEISKKVTLIIGIIILIVYIGVTAPELAMDEAEQYPDFEILKDGLEIWPSGESDDIYVREQNDRVVRMFLLDISNDVLQNIKILPFVASIILVIFTYLLTYEITQKRFAGITSMVVLLQSFTFLKYDTIAVYENFWVLFYVISLYLIYKKWWILSAPAYILSVFTKAFVAPYLLMNIFFAFRTNITRKQKILLLISYVIAFGIVLGLFSGQDAIYADVVRIDFDRFAMAFGHFSAQMRFDYLLLFTILPITVGLFFISKSGIKQADSILVLFFGTLFAGPVVALLTDHYVILPYRFVPLIVFFAIAIGLIFSRRINQSV